MGEYNWVNEGAADGSRAPSADGGEISKEWHGSEY